jgi:hypothetical protein
LTLLLQTKDETGFNRSVTERSTLFLGSFRPRIAFHLNCPANSLCTHPALWRN